MNDMLKKAQKVKFWESDQANPGHEAYTVANGKRGNVGHADGATQIDKFQFK